MTFTFASAADARRAAPRPQRPDTRFIAHARAIAGGSRDAATLATQLRASLDPALGMRVETPPGTSNTVTLHFGSPIPATLVAQALGWYGGYAISGDVHQSRWYFVQRTGDLATDRIATELPHIGRWDVRIVLAGRPAGSLPTLVSGASPAYDLSHYPADAVEIEFSAHR
jgi:hypothetical protein